MDCSQYKMAGFGRVQGQTHGFGIAHFANHQDVRIFAHGINQGLLESGGVAADFALADKRANGRELILDGLFESNDVAGLRLVDLLDQRSHGGGFATPGWPANEDEAMSGATEAAKFGMEVEALQRGLE